MKIVKVTWLDSCFVGNGWVDKDSVKNTPAIIHSLGYLLHEDNTAITVVPHLSTGEGEGSGIMVIPRESITSIDELILYSHMEQIELFPISVPEGHEHRD